jgi:hypothetical protein
VYFHLLACSDQLQSPAHNAIRSPLDLSTINSGLTVTFLHSDHSPHDNHKISSKEAIVTMPPEVVRIRASSTVFVKASSLWNLLLASGIMQEGSLPQAKEWIL